MIARFGTKTSYSNFEIAVASFFFAMTLLSQNVMQIGAMLFNNSNIFNLLMIVACVYTIGVFGINISQRNIIILSFVFICFAISVLLFNNQFLHTYFRSFVMYGIVAMIIANSCIRETYIYIFGSIMGLLWLVLYYLKNGTVVNDSFSFGYLMLPTLLFLFMLFYDNREKKYIRLLFLVPFVVCLGFMFVSASRGPLLSFLIFILLFFLRKDRYGFKKILVIIALILLVMNVRNIMYYIHAHYPGKISFVEKSVILDGTSGGLSNGRNHIIQSLFKDYSIFDFIFGTGIGSYANLHNGDYTHNLITSLALEMGILPVGYVIYRGISFIRNGILENDIWCLLLVALGAIPLLFSDIFWMSYPFWLFIFYVPAMVED
ncbi:hypothetical protein RO787_18685 [Blautia coccoides]|uniref:hypothetical protein n=1 Tax=Blautia producta TaxID=33035 RepID=UPI0028A3510F|nr:hypothetical protein [Blautia coccoides]MDT4375367.1 hypothetical protein [Blautia coccoides]